MAIGLTVPWQKRVLPISTSRKRNGINDENFIRSINRVSVVFM